VVEQRTLGLARVALVELDPRAADLDPRDPVFRLGRREPELQILLRRRGRVVRVERGVVEVELDVGRRLDEVNLDPAGQLVVLGGTVEGADAKRDVLDRATFPRPLEPRSVNFSCLSITCMPRWRVA
jgi:hypothetical protein